MAKDRKLQKSWTECPGYREYGCHFEGKDASTFRLNITNALGTLSVDVPEYSPLDHFTAPAPNITSVVPVSSHTMDIRWTLSGCNLYIQHFKYKLTYQDRSTGEELTPVIIKYDRQHALILENANTEYCFQMTARKSSSDWGLSSKEVCRRTLPTVPNVGFEGTDYTTIQSEEREDERDIILTWKLIKTDSKPFQGVSRFELEVRRDRKTIDDGTEGNTTIIYDLEGRNDYSLDLDTFNHTIQGLARYENYTITLLAVNSAGRSKAVTLKVVAMVVSKEGISVLIIAGVCVPLVVLLILALLAFAYQRLENNSKDLPKPVYRDNVGNVKPTNIEREVFDELPSVTKEKQRQLLISLSRESADSQSEDKGYRTSSTSTSGVETDTSSLERGKVEKVPLLKMREMRNLGGSIDSSPYSLLSELTPSRPHLQMAQDAVETDLDSFSPPGGHYSSTDEGTSVGGSSSYNQLSCFRDTSHPNPYYSMFGQVPVRSIEPSNDSGYVADGSQQCSNVGYDDHLLRADDADDESSQPSTPATPNCAYYSSLSDRTDPAGQDRSSGPYCDPYVIAAAMPSSPPLRLQSVNLATIEESPNHYVPQAAPRVPNSHNGSQPPWNSGYVDNTDIFMGRPSSPQDDASIDSNPSSSQSSPEHAVIIHTNTRRNPDPSGEYMDNTYFSHMPSTPLSNSSLPTSAVIDTPIASPVKSSPRTPQSNGYVDCPPTSNSPSTRPKGNSGYVTCEQLQQVQTSLPLEDTRQASEQPLQSPAHVGTVLPTLSRNASAYVPITQMPVPVQSAYIPADTPAQRQASQIDSGPSGMDTMLPQSLPAADVNNEPTDGEQEPLRDDHRQVNSSGYQPQEEIPNTKLERVRESPTLSNSNEGLQVCDGSAPSQVGPNRHRSLPCVNNGGYVSKDMTNFPCRTDPSFPIELNNNGYVRIN
ncbi:uncharacterized protein LOC115918977 [Strongylocentrotus purpuratus]|uniref:Fibronectin type-III domain-containing protein n=1 Tax=Strongylocentrotus purpuratus TaxID=7668 RepID=A0A7M7PLG6_STRPU|nr:uncharacterized protein LOC115918977 [Strongylocentrotus purpuratus]